MSASFIEQLNLTPQERRIVVVIAVIVFIVLNMLLVWPHFSDLGKIKEQLDDTRKTIKKENDAILKDVDPVHGYQKKLAELQQHQGGGIGNQQIQLQRSVSDQAIRNGVVVGEIRPITSTQASTNEFYEEQTVKISFECQEPQLINFLYNIGNDPAMIRVRELNLRTADANRYRLKGDATLSANYAKQPSKQPAAAPKAAPAPGKTPPPAAKPAPGKPPAGPVKPGPGNRSIPGPNIPISPRTAPAAQPYRKNL